jgi:CBS domain-containing protein
MFLEDPDMIVSEVMSTAVFVASPDQTLTEAARSMADLDTGVLPVGEDDKLIGVVTDRDIVIRGVAEERDPHSTTLREVMSVGVCYCYDDEDVQDVAEQMAELQVRRLPVINREKNLVGIVSLGDLSQRAATGLSGEALQGISE